MKNLRTYLSLSLFLVAALSAIANAEGTQLWTQNSYDDFAKGTSKGIAINSRGRLSMAPAFESVFTSPSTFLWSIVSDSEGNAYLAAGAPARVYRVTPQGKASIIFEPKELQVQALAIDAAGTLYAATSPDGKVYKIEHAGKVASTGSSTVHSKAGHSDSDAVTFDKSFSATPYFDPKTKYIWALAADKEGRLYVATGDRGEIFRVEKDGQGALFFKSDEAHIRSLAFDHDGNLIAGSDGSGLIYRIKPSGEAFVLYSAPKKEITALAVDADGYIFAAGSGDEHPPNIMQPPLPAFAGAPNVPPGVMLPIINTGVTGGSEIYMIAPDGLPRKIWGHKDELVYALAIDNSGALIAGSGNRGSIFRIARDGTFTDLQKASANQVTGFAAAPGGAIYAATSNLGKLFRLSTKPSGDASYESDVFDAHIFSRWGRAEVRGSGDFDFYARTGNVDNPDRNWSTWSKVDLSTDSELRTPPARFVQWRVVMHATHPEAEVSSVKINYRSQNVAPVIEDIVVVPGARFTQAIVNSQRAANEMVNISVGAAPANGVTIGTNNFSTSVMQAQKDHSAVAVRWAAHDDNDDDLLYSLYYRGDGEREWKLLKNNLTDKFYSFDSGLLPDGGYTMKVVATDSPSHTPEDALTDSRESNRFEIDNTPPQVEALDAKLDGGQLHISFSAKDSFSPIKRAEFSVDAGEWQFIEPVGLLSDSPTETYDFNVPAPGASDATSNATDSAAPGTKQPRDKKPAGASSPEHIVVVRVYDRFDNMGVAKVLVK